MPRGENNGVVLEARHRAWVVSLLHQVGEPKVALPLHFGAREYRTEHHVGHQIERRAHRALGYPKRDIDRVPVRASEERGTKICNIRRQGIGVASPGSLVQHACGESRESRHGSVIPAAAGHAEDHLHQRNLVHRHHHESEPIGEPGVLHRGHLEARRRREGGRSGDLSIQPSSRPAVQAPEEECGSREDSVTHGVTPPARTPSSGLPFGTTLSTAFGARR